MKYFNFKLLTITLPVCSIKERFIDDKYYFINLNICENIFLYYYLYLAFGLNREISIK